MLSFFKNPKDTEILKDYLEEVKDETIKIKVWLTILAVYVFQKFFSSREDEW